MSTYQRGYNDSGIYNSGRLICSLLFGVTVLTLALLRPAVAQESRTKVEFPIPAHPSLTWPSLPRSSGTSSSKTGLRSKHSNEISGGQCPPWLAGIFTTSPGWA